MILFKDNSTKYDWHSLVCLIMLLLVLWSSPLSAQESNPRRVDREHMINLEDYLYRVGNDHGIRFTTEFVVSTSRRGELQQVDASNVEIAEDLSAAALTEKLNQNFPKFRFVASKHDSRILHVIDKRLDQFESYALAQKMTFKFAGTPHGMIRKLHESIANIGPRESGSFRQAFDDDDSQIEVNGQKQEVRNLLTSGSKWGRYGPLIWRAETALDTEKTIVQFYGPQQRY